MATARDDPFGSFNFLVELDGITVAGFTECSGLSNETDVIEYREGGDPSSIRKIPGLTRYSRIVLKRGITKSRDLWNWRKTVIDGRPERKSGSIILLAADRSEVARWTFVQGWPAKWEGPQLKAKTSEVAIETIEIEHEGLDLET